MDFVKFHDASPRRFHYNYSRIGNVATRVLKIFALEVIGFFHARCVYLPSLSVVELWWRQYNISMNSFAFVPRECIIRFTIGTNSFLYAFIETFLRPRSTFFLYYAKDYTGFIHFFDSYLYQKSYALIQNVGNVCSFIILPKNLLPRFSEVRSATDCTLNGTSSSTSKFPNVLFRRWSYPRWSRLVRSINKYKRGKKETRERRKEERKKKKKGLTVRTMR